MAEQSLQSIKVVHTYGREELESHNYNKYLGRVLETSRKVNNLKSLGPTIFQSLFSLYFGYAMYWGGYLRWNEIKSITGELYSSAILMTIMMLMMVSTLSLGTVGTMLPSIGKAKIAGQFAFEVIDHIPSIQVDEPGKLKVKREEI